MVGGIAVAIVIVIVIVIAIATVTTAAAAMLSRRLAALKIKFVRAAMFVGLFALPNSPPLSQARRPATSCEWRRRILILASLANGAAAQAGRNQRGLFIKLCWRATATANAPS